MKWEKNANVSQYGVAIDADTELFKNLLVCSLINIYFQSNDFESLWIETKFAFYEFVGKSINYYYYYFFNSCLTSSN